MRTLITLARLLIIVVPGAAVHAQELEPRAYSNAPIGINFLIGGAGYADGTTAFDPSSSITDANFHSTGGAVAYARTLGLAGKSGLFSVALPYSSFAGNALVGGERRTREMSGFSDPKFHYSINLYGAPALPLKEFVSYRQDLVIGASLQVTAPLGDYDNTKLINLGNNRWSFKSELGFSKAWGAWIVEVMPSVTFYTDNTDFNRGKTFEQDPLYALQWHLVRTFRSGIWIAADATWYQGNRTMTNGVKADNLQSNSRAGLTLSLPVNRNNSVKLYASGGTTTRTGSEFNAIGAAWQYRWGGGF